MPIGTRVFKGFAARFAVQQLNTRLALSALVEFRQSEQSGVRQPGQGDGRGGMRRTEGCGARKSQWQRVGGGRPVDPPRKPRRRSSSAAEAPPAGYGSRAAI